MSGVLAKLLALDLAEVEKALAQAVRQEGQGRRPEPGRRARPATTTPPRTLTKHDPFHDRADERDGRQDHHRRQLGGGDRRMFAGVTVVPWYPITPSSSLCESLIDYMKKYRVGRQTARRPSRSCRPRTRSPRSAWCSARAGRARASMTATAGPGISLMAEFAGLGYYAEIPGGDLRRAARRAVDRAADAHGAGRHLLSTAFLSHGDTKHPMLIPARWRSASLWRGRRSTSPSSSRRRCS